MDGWILTLFVLAAFAGGFVSGFSGSLPKSARVAKCNATDV